MIRSHVPCPLDDGRLVPAEALAGSRGRPRTCSLPGNSRTLCPLSYARMRRSPPASGRRAAQRTRTPSARIKSPVPVQSGAGSRSGPPPAPGRGGRAGSGAAPGIRTRNLCGLSAAPLPIGLERRESGCRESDPGLHHGQVMRCHYATSAWSRHPVPTQAIRGTKAEPQPCAAARSPARIRTRRLGPGPGGPPVTHRGNEWSDYGESNPGPHFGGVWLCH